MMIKKIFLKFIKRYKCKAGYGEFLNIAVPLIICTGMISIQQFINRMFLSWHSQIDLAASLPAGVLNFTIMSLFVGTVSYVDVFIAQYYGREDYEKIGPAVWQGVYLAVAGAAVLLLISFFSKDIFGIINHNHDVMIKEISYFKILCYGAFPALACSSFSGFYAGQGKTKIIVLINIVTITINCILDYILIFGKLGFPNLGIKGAGIATIISSFIMMVIYIVLITSKNNDGLFSTRNIRIDFSFLKRLWNYGFANGIQFFFDMAGFTFFVFVIGKIGTLALTASTIVLNINMLMFMPVLGLGMTTSIMVAQNLGRNNTFLAVRSVYSALHIAFVHVLFVISCYLFLADFFIAPFLKDYPPELYNQIYPICITLLQFLAVYAVGDPICIIFSFAIKGAGDTAFVMKTLILSVLCVIIIPLTVIILIFKLGGLYTSWTILTTNIIVLAVSFFLRYRTGKWKRMRVINQN